LLRSGKGAERALVVVVLRPDDLQISGEDAAPTLAIYAGRTSPSAVLADSR
jgi:hypothetical protein